MNKIISHNDFDKNEIGMQNKLFHINKLFHSSINYLIEYTIIHENI